jgi:hypothetical protein
MMTSWLLSRAVLVDCLSLVLKEILHRDFAVQPLLISLLYSDTKHGLIHMTKFCFNFDIHFCSFSIWQWQGATKSDGHAKGAKQI